MVKILLIEDDPSCQILVKRTLNSDSIDLLIADTSQSALDLLKKNKIQLIILDLSLPDQNGIELCSQLQNSEETQNIPIIILTCKSDLSNKVTAFSLGVEDYIVKPFEEIEFKARIEAKMRKILKTTTEDDIIVKADLDLNISKQKAFLMANGEKQDIGLTPLEFKILYQLARREENIMSREQLLNHVWGTSTNILDRTVDSHISSLRKKLGTFSKYIESIPREGYRFKSSISSH